MYTLAWINHKTTKRTNSGQKKEAAIKTSCPKPQTPQQATETKQTKNQPELDPASTIKTAKRTNSEQQ